jgi:hypothetical protein
LKLRVEEERSPKPGSFEGAQSKKQGLKRGFAPLQKSLSPFPFLRGRGIKGDGVI